MSKSDNTTLVIVIVALLLLLLFANGSLSSLFVSQTPLTGAVEYGATTDFNPNLGQLLGDTSSNGYVNALSQEIFVPENFQVHLIQIRIGYRNDNPTLLGPFSVGLASTYDGVFIWNVLFDPNSVPEDLFGNLNSTNFLYNFTVPFVTVHNVTCVRIEYAGTTNNDGIAQFLEMRFSNQVTNNTHIGMWRRSTNTFGFEHWDRSVFYLYCRVAGN